MLSVSPWNPISRDVPLQAKRSEVSYDIRVLRCGVLSSMANVSANSIFYGYTEERSFSSFFFFFVFARGFKGKSLIVKEGNYISSSNRFLWMRTHRHEIKFLYYMYVSVKCLVYSWRIRRIYAYTSIMMQIKRDIHRKICLHFISLHILECARLSSVFRSNN